MKELFSDIMAWVVLIILYLIIWTIRRQKLEISRAKKECLDKLEKKELAQWAE